MLFCAVNQLHFDITIMTISGKRVKKRWMLMFAAMTAVSVSGLFASSSEGQFDLPNDNLWANIAWMITATIFVLMMTPGLSFFYGGMVRAKNVISTMLQSFIVMGAVSVIWVVFGFSLAFGNDICHIIGNPLDFLMFDGVGVQNVTADGIAIAAFLNTNTAAATAMVTWVVFDCLRGHKPSAMGAAIGAVIGLVAITPCAGWVTVGQSIFIAFATTLCCNMAVTWKNSARHTFDDALDVFPTHGLGGIIGTVFTGIFAYGFFVRNDGLEISHTEFFWNHILVVAIVIVYTFIVSYALYWLTDKMIPLRVSRRSEEIGLDRSQHDEEYGTEATTELAEDTVSDSDWLRSVSEN